MALKGTTKGEREMTTTIRWKTENGKIAEASIAKSRETEADDSTYIVLRHDGKYIACGNSAPVKITKALYGSHRYTTITAAGGFAKLGDVYITEQAFNRIIDALNKINKN